MHSRWSSYSSVGSYRKWSSKLQKYIYGTWNTSKQCYEYPEEEEEEEKKPAKATVTKTQTPSLSSPSVDYYRKTYGIGAKKEETSTSKAVVTLEDDDGWYGR